MEDAQKLREISDELICVNDAWRLCRDADHIYGTDMRWWSWAIADISREFDGELWTQRVQWTEEPEAWGIVCLESEDGDDICTEPGKIHTGSNSGFAAINLAYHLAATRIVLLGFDMGVDGARRHSVTGRPEHLNVQSCYVQFIKRFKTINPAKHGIEILNASRRTALTCFPLVDLDDL